MPTQKELQVGDMVCLRAAAYKLQRYQKWLPDVIGIIVNIRLSYKYKEPIATVFWQLAEKTQSIYVHRLKRAR